MQTGQRVRHLIVKLLYDEPPLRGGNQKLLHGRPVAHQNDGLWRSAQLGGIPLYYSLFYNRKRSSEERVPTTQRTGGAWPRRRHIAVVFLI